MNIRFGALAPFIACAALALAPGRAQAQTASQVYGGPVERKLPTLFVRGEAGYTTYNSRMVDSNAAGISTRATFGAFAGEMRRVGMVFSSTDTSMKFPLNDSSVRTSFRDLRAQARIGYVLPTAIVSLSEVRGEKEKVELVDLYGTSFGGGVALMVPVFERLMVHGEALYIKTDSAHDKKARKVSLGDRVEADIAASFSLIGAFLDLNVGYNYRRYSVGVETATGDTDWKETQSMPFAGFQVGAFF